MFRLEIKAELEDTLEHIDATLRAVKKEAEKLEIDPFDLRDSAGSWPVTPLLVARAQVLAALAVLEAHR